MAYITNIPSLTYLLVLYFIIVFTTGNTALEAMDAELFNIPLISQATLKVTVSELLILLGVIALYIEIFKSTRTSSSDTIVEHGISMALFIVYLVLFLILEKAATSAFLILMMIQLLDVVGGFTISISTARRDINMTPH